MDFSDTTRVFQNPFTLFGKLEVSLPWKTWVNNL